MLAVEAVLVEIRRRAVRGGDDRHAGIEQRGHQPREDHRVGAVGDHHLVEREQAGLVGDRGGDGDDRVADFLAAFGGDPRVDLHHELAEMHAAFLLDGHVGEEQVHQHRLAAADPAPEVDAAGVWFLGEAGEEAGGFGGGEFGGEGVEAGSGGGLFRVGAEFA